MSTEPVVFTGRLEYADLLEIYRLNLRLMVRPSILVLLGAVSATLLALLVGVAVVTGPNLATVAFAVLFLYCPFGWLLERRIFGRRRLRRLAPQMSENTATITGESVSITNAESAVCLAWKFVRIVQTARGLAFVLRTNRIWFFLPQRLFEGGDARERIIAFAIARQVPVQTLP